jgi:hypothetical protein
MTIVVIAIGIILLLIIAGVIYEARRPPTPDEIRVAEEQGFKEPMPPRHRDRSG